METDFKIYFKVITQIPFGHKGYEEGYCGTKVSIPEFYIKPGEEFYVEYLFDTEEVQLEYLSHSSVVLIHWVIHELFLGNIKQIDSPPPPKSSSLDGYTFFGPWGLD